MVFLEKINEVVTPFIAASAALLGAVAAIMVAYAQIKRLRKASSTPVPPAKGRKAVKRKGSRFARIARVSITAAMWAIPAFLVVFLLGYLAGGRTDIATLGGLLGGSVATGMMAYIGGASTHTGKSRKVIVVIVVRAVPVFFIVSLLGLLAGGGVNMSIRGRLSLSVSNMYHPSGKMGDIGDLGILRLAGEDQFQYEPLGRGPHEWEWKYIDGEPNDRPALFAGVMYLHPPGNWGTDPNGGRDLRRAGRVLTWEARCDHGEVYVEFVVGGVNWLWDEQHKRVTAPYPDSMPRTSLGTKRLTPNWEQFSVDLRQQGLDKEEYFNRVIGGFGWVISWAPNGVSWDGKARRPDTVRKFELEVRNIRYERRSL